MTHIFDHCGIEMRVIDTRRTIENIRRRRECQVCGHRVTTYELMATEEMIPPKGQPPLIRPPKEELRFHYYNERIIEVAVRYHTNVNTIYIWLDHYGIPLKGARRKKAIIPKPSRKEGNDLENLIQGLVYG